MGGAGLALPFVAAAGAALLGRPRSAGAAPGAESGGRSGLRQRPPGLLLGLGFLTLLGLLSIQGLGVAGKGLAIEITVDERLKLVELGLEILRQHGGLPLGLLAVGLVLELLKLLGEGFPRRQKRVLLDPLFDAGQVFTLQPRLHALLKPRPQGHKVDHLVAKASS